MLGAYDHHTGSLSVISVIVLHTLRETLECFILNWSNHRSHLKLYLGVKYLYYILDSKWLLGAQLTLIACFC